MDILKFWAKTSKESERKNAFHPLICHLIDVAAVTKKMWEEVLPEAAKVRINKSFGVENAGNLVAFIAGLHDLGKCSPPFALRGKQIEEQKVNLEKLLLKQKDKESDYAIRIQSRLQTIHFLKIYEKTPFHIEDSVPVAKDAPHGYVTTIELPEILGSYEFNEDVARQISILIGGHHGVFPNSDWRKGGRKAIPQNLGNEMWENARIELAETLAKLFDVKPIKQSEAAKLDNGTIMLLAGLVSVADWIGSMSEYFECAAEQTVDNKVTFDWKNLDAYLEHAEAKAEIALKELGWIARKKENSTKKFDANQSPEQKFKKLFRFITTPRHLQDMAIEISRELKTPGIAVIEAPTGEGKTEAAMFLADAWNTSLNQNGYYFALPTQATSNQMFGRAVNFLKNRFPDRDVQLQLLHGHASLSAEFATLKEEHKKIKDVFDDQCEGDECVPSVVAAEWFTYRKRGLLAPFGVGTIDQALMAVLQTKHVFVRLFGLAHKTIIIDEVHAYDAYMSTLLERLLEWLAALGSPVILLSATLPIERRNKLIEAYQRGLGVGTNEIRHADYPRISYAVDSTINVKHINKSQKSRPLYIKKVDENFIENLKEKLKEDKGCVAIICNTVQRSQDIFDELSKDDFFKDKIDLLHARFRFIDREEREKRVLERFGKPDENGESPNRPKCAVLIATQIIEQSLDLDFDLMISDLAPIDLLLQRAGRLQRHDRDLDKTKEDNERPKNYRNKPTLWIIQPPTDENGFLKLDKKGLPDFGKAGVIYDKHILLRTWLELNKKEYEKIEIPGEVENLIESVYDKKVECSDEKYQQFWDDSKSAMQNKLKEKRIKAKSCRITDADDEDLFENDILELDEDKPEVHKTLQALTRDNEMPSVSVVVLTSDEAEKVNLQMNPNDYSKKFLLKRETKITKKGLTNLILTDENLKQESWKKSPLLRHHRLLQLDKNNKIEIGNFTVSLDEKLGVVIKTGEKNGK